MTTRTDYPIKEILNALDVLQDNQVLEDAMADHCLGEWMLERGLTDEDLQG